MLLVLLFHTDLWESQYGLSTGIIAPFHWFGFAGVDLFFVLSGFLIAWTQQSSVGRPARLPSYLFRRAYRIYPTYWVCLLLSIGILWAGFALAPPTHGQDWLQIMSLWPAWLPERVMPPSWTLSFELMFYIVFAVRILLPRRLGQVALLGWAIAVLAAWPYWSPSWSLEPWHLLNPFVLEFLGGVLVAGLIRNGVTGRSRTVLVLSLMYALTAGLVGRSTVSIDWLNAMAWHTIRVVIFGPPAIGIVYSLAAMELRSGRRVLPWLQPIGDASYSIYLTHYAVGQMALAYGCYMPHTLAWHLLWLAGVFYGSILYGWLVHRLIERPLLNRTRRQRSTHQAEA